MFGTIRKHQTWLWGILVAVMSISLVALFTSNPGASGGRHGELNLGTINGQPIDLADYLDAESEIKIAAFIHTGKWPEDDPAGRSRVKAETISRVFILKKLKSMDIRASDVAASMLGHEQLRDMPWTTFEKEYLLPHKVTLADYERYLRNEASIRQLIAAASLSARLVTPAEAELVWRKENQEVQGQIACFWTSNYLDKVTITNGAIGNFYTNRMNVSYRIPERLTLAYVEFNASNFLAEADDTIAKQTNFNENISELYLRSRGDTNAWTDTNGVPLPEEAAKAKIKEEFRQNYALRSARRAASDFGNDLYNRPDANQVTNLAYLAELKKLEFKVTKPFDNRTNGLEEFEDVPLPSSRSADAPKESLRDLVREKAFNLTDGQPILLSPIVGPHAVYVIARKGKLPSEVQPLEKIVDKVTVDYRSFMAMDLARKAGLAFHTNLTNGLSLGKSFDELCAAEKVPVTVLPTFSPVTKALANADPRVNFRQLQPLADDLEVGKASPLLPAQPFTEGAYLFFAKARPPIDVAKMKTELPEFINQLRVFRQNESFQLWFRKQAEQARLAMPRDESTVGSAN